MGQRKYPPLTPPEVIAILKSLGFKLDRKTGSHEHYECERNEKQPRSVVTVDVAYSQFDEFLMKSMIRQSNRSREEFYGATKRSAQKASVRYVKISTSTDSD